MQYLLSLGELALRALLLGAMGMVTAWIARRRGAEVQHAIWAVVLAGMLALPLLTATLPPVGVLPRRVAPIVPTPVLPPAGDVAPSKPEYGRIPSGAGISPPLHRDFNWPTVLFATYCAGVAFRMLRTAVALRRTGRAVQESVPVRDAGTGALLENTAVALGMGYPLPELRESGSVPVPFTAG